MNLYATGTILGVRAKADVTNRETGEVSPSKSKLIDIYDEHSGPGQLEAPVELQVPTPGTRCSFAMAVRAYAGFRQGSDPRVVFTCTAVTPLENDQQHTANGRARAAAK